MHNAEFARCLAELDVAGVRRLWRHVSPHLPQPHSDREALLAIHHARTQTQTFSLRLRAFSHAWLLDHGYPSALPDELKPKAERMYPRVVEAVGIAVCGMSDIGRVHIAPIVQGAMVEAVMDIYADDNHPDPVRVKRRMLEARSTTVKKLLGRF